MGPVSIFSYYGAKSWENFRLLPLSAQIGESKNLKAVLLDYTGMISRFVKVFRNSNISIFLVENKSEDISRLIEGYDIVFLMVNPDQDVDLDRYYIKITVYRNKILTEDLLE